MLDYIIYSKVKKTGQFNPFDTDNQVVICSYNFAARKDSEIKVIPWNLVIMDEAHRLRNVYKSSNVMGNKLKNALQGRKKLLLTATLLQNNLMELYGLVSIIDDHLQTDKLYALPQSQRTLITMVLRKLLASSTFAIAGTLQSLIARLNSLLQSIEADLDITNYDTYDELHDENSDNESTLTIDLQHDRESVLFPHFSRVLIKSRNSSARPTNQPLDNFSQKHQTCRQGLVPYLI